MRRLIVLTMLLGTGLVAQEQASVVNAAAPGYPRSPTIEGEVLVEFQLAPDGQVIRAQAKSGPQRLRIAAEKAAGGWRFAPNGPESTQIVFAFIMQPGMGDPPVVASIFKAPNRMEVFAEKREFVVISDPPVEATKKPEKVRKPRN